MELTDGFKSNIVETGKTLRGVQRRLFMARTVRIEPCSLQDLTRHVVRHQAITRNFFRSSGRSALGERLGLCGVVEIDGQEVGLRLFDHLLQALERLGTNDGPGRFCLNHHRLAGGGVPTLSCLGGGLSHPLDLQQTR